MVNLKWDIHNWITVLLMVGLAYAFAGVVKSLLSGGGVSFGSAPTQDAGY